MALLAVVFNFFLTLVVVGMAYMEYRTTKDKMFLYIANAFAFFAVAHLAEALGVVTLVGDFPIAVIQLIGYLAVAYGIYSQSKIYKVIR